MKWIISGVLIALLAGCGLRLPGSRRAAETPPLTESDVQVIVNKQVADALAKRDAELESVKQELAKTSEKLSKLVRPVQARNPQPSRGVLENRLAIEREALARLEAEYRDAHRRFGENKGMGRGANSSIYYSPPGKGKLIAQKRRVKNAETALIGK